MDSSDPRLKAIAREVVWWEPAEVTLSDQDEFLSRVMARGSWKDIVLVDNIFGEEALWKALQHSRPGVIDPASWHYWHHRLGISPVPEMPKRAFG